MRYLGGEVGSLAPLGRDEPDPNLLVALSFPDLYEIGMSNNAVRLLYGALNRRPGLRCERVFAPAPDFEAALAARGLPLSTLESGIPLVDCDLVGFTVGYELAATSILTILNAGGVPLLAAERGPEHPLVIAGGPAVSNPHYLAPFLDAVWIGEAEDAFFELCDRLGAMRLRGEGRGALLEEMRNSPHVWMPGKKAVRAIYDGFPASPYRMTFPVPVMKAVQSHGTVEVMRGCPHGCRFCHAGIWYRPQRMKPAPLIQEEVRELVERGGYHEVTLASLSSGDYAGIGELVSALNAEWSARGISFQLPSLKVNTFTLPLIEAVSSVRKSGLTFAVESPEDFRQLVINKDVAFDRIVDILREAKGRGFRAAKFYFMLGLPVPGRGVGEAEAIVAFFQRLTALVQLSFNVNVGIFVPKPHTPFQWCGQLPDAEAMEAIQVLRAGLRPLRGIKLSWHSPFVSQLESVFARGDERVGELILEAWRRGARLDAWEEHFDRERWAGVLADAGWDPVDLACTPRETDAPLPWDDILPRVSKRLLLEEWRRSQEAVLTSACTDSCNSPCGACSEEHGVILNTAAPAPVTPAASTILHDKAGRLLFRYAKSGPGALYPHLGLIEALGRAFQVLKLPVSWSEGFNPAPRMELSPPLPLGVASLDELGAVVLARPLGPAEAQGLADRINAELPRGVRVLEVAQLPPEAAGRRAPSISAELWGADYLLQPRSGTSLDAFARRIAPLLSRSSPGLYVAPEGDGYRVTFPLPANREESLLRLLEASGDGASPFDVLTITKKATLAEHAGQLGPLWDRLKNPPPAKR